MSIPTVAKRQSRDYVYLPSPYPREQPNFPSVFTQPANNQTLGFLTNHRSVYSYEMQLFNNQAWNEPLVTGVFVFVVRSNIKSLLSKRSTLNSKRTTLATLPLVNYMLASDVDNNKFQTFEQVAEILYPLGVITTMQPENTATLRSPSVVLNVIIQGNAESTYNLWGAIRNVSPLSKVYFKLVVRTIKANESLRFSLGNRKNAIEYIQGSSESEKKVLQIVPYVSHDGLPPKKVQGSVLGYWYIGRLVEATQLRDIYGSRNKDFDDSEDLSRTTENILSKSKLVKLFIN